MDMAVYSWQICVKTMCTSKWFFYFLYAKCRELIQRCCMKFIQSWQLFSLFFFVRLFVCLFFFFFFSNNFRFTSNKYITFGHPKVHRPTYLIVISTDDLASYRPHIRIWYGMLTKIHQLTVIDLNMLVIIWRQQCILFIYYFVRLFFSEIARLCSFIIDTFLFCT